MLPSTTSAAVMPLTGPLPSYRHLARTPLPFAPTSANTRLLHKIFDEMRAKYGKLDILISNAALGLYTEAMKIDDKAWDLSMHTNAQAFLLCVQHASDMMPDGSRIVSLVVAGVTSLYRRLCGDRRLQGRHRDPDQVPRL